MICVVVVLAYLLKGRYGLESAFLHSPHFPVHVARSAYLIVVLGIEGKTTHRHALL
jgi:hypothetical protein